MPATLPPNTTVHVCDTATGECYEQNPKRAVICLAEELGLSETAVVDRLLAATADAPLSSGQWDFWTTKR